MRLFLWLMRLAFVFWLAATRPVLAAAEAPAQGVHGEFSEFTESGIDRTNAQVAPSPFEEWKEAGYSNVAPKDWKHWEGIEDEHLKHFPVQLDPKDVADRGLFWNVFTNYKTAFPAIIMIGFPLIGQGHMHMDWHIEAAAIFWTVLYGVSAATSSGMYNAISSGSEAKRTEVLAAEAEYTKAIHSTMLAHERAVALPRVMDELNKALATLHEQEARAATMQVKLEHRHKMVEMLDYLIATQGREEEGADLVITSAVDATEAKLATDSKFAQKVLDEAINAFASGSASSSVISAEFSAQLATFETNPPVDADSDPEAVAAKFTDLFTKRFGYDSDVVTDSMMKKAENDPTAMAYLSARCGGNAPTVGAKITERSPIDF